MTSIQPARTAASEGVKLLELGSPMEALATFRAAIANGDRRPETQLNLAIAEEKAGDAEAARRRMRRVAEENPAWDEPPLRLAESFRRADDWASAELAYRLTLDLNPTRLEALVALGAGLILRDRPHEAVPLLTRAAAHPGADVEAWHALGLALLATGDPAGAEQALARANEVAPDRFDIALQRADAALDAGRGEDELARLEALEERSPLDALPLRVHAHLLQRMGRVAECADLLEAACELAPDDVDGLAELGTCLANMGRPPEAEAALRRVLELDPAHQQSRADLAAVLLKRLLFAEAEAVLRNLIRDVGERQELLCNLALACLGQGQQSDAIASSKRATEIAPHAVTPWRSYCSVLPYAADAEAQVSAVRACAQRYPRGASHAFTNVPDPERPLRVGLLSNSMRTHPVGWLTLAGLEALDPAAFDLVCLGSFARANVVARRFNARASTWLELDGLDDAAVAHLCRDLALDIVIDLGGHGDAGRLGVIAHRAAPVQIKWVGSQFGSTGLPEMDWFLTDRWETPDGSAELYVERLLQLPDGYVCYDPPIHAPDVTPLPALARQCVTFGCFNNISKITPTVIQTWARVLEALPHATLLLKAAQLCDEASTAQFKTRLAAFGLDPQRVECRGTTPHREHLAAYGDVDIVLDPFPYSGGLSTCEALWMGVPTVSLPGRTFASRHTVSHQENAGLHGWAAASVDDYVALAIEKASDLSALATLRAGLRARVAASPLCDAPRFGRNLGAALRHSWRAWCEAQR